MYLLVWAVVASVRVIYNKPSQQMTARMAALHTTASPTEPYFCVHWPLCFCCSTAVKMRRIQFWWYRPLGCSQMSWSNVLYTCPAWSNTQTQAQRLKNSPKTKPSLLLHCLTDLNHHNATLLSGIFSKDKRHLTVSEPSYLSHKLSGNM